MLHKNIVENTKFQTNTSGYNDVRKVDQIIFWLSLTILKSSIEID